MSTDTSTDTSTGAGTGMSRLALKVNGRPVCATVEARTHLADFVREHLHLTGTNIGCEQGVCGACTLSVDGVPMRSCTVFAATCPGADVRTIEDFDHDPVMAALREAFSAEHALQCGYCTPGMLATARDIVLRLPDADDARVRHELSGNLCRCTGYVGLVRAVRRVLDQRRAGAGNLVTADAATANPIAANPIAANPIAADPASLRAQAARPAHATPN